MRRTKKKLVNKRNMVNDTADWLKARSTWQLRRMAGTLNAVEDPRNADRITLLVGLGSKGKRVNRYFQTQGVL
jgi:hypothetical protein